MTDDRIPLKTLVSRLNIRISCEWADRNPNMEDAEWARDATHWKVTLRYKRRRLTTYFSQGAAHTDEPTAADVLGCLASDASSIDGARSFEDWASDLGYDTDSRKAERTFKLCERQAIKLRRFLGAEYEQVISAEW